MQSSMILVQMLGRCFDAPSSSSSLHCSGVLTPPFLHSLQNDMNFDASIGSTKKK